MSERCPLTDQQMMEILEAGFRHLKELSGASPAVTEDGGVVEKAALTSRRPTGRAKSFKPFYQHSTGKLLTPWLVGWRRLSDVCMEVEAQRRLEEEGPPIPMGRMEETEPTKCPGFSGWDVWRASQAQQEPQPTQEQLKALSHQECKEILEAGFRHLKELSGASPAVTEDGSVVKKAARTSRGPAGRAKGTKPFYQRSTGKPLTPWLVGWRRLSDACMEIEAQRRLEEEGPPLPMGRMEDTEPTKCPGFLGWGPSQESSAGPPGPPEVHDSSYWAKGADRYRMNPPPIPWPEIDEDDPIQ
jgi:hypothetical protein